MPTTTHPTTTRRLYSPGHGQPEVDGDQISREASAAAAAGQDLSTACPYPFHTEAGQQFTALYRKARWAGVAGDVAEGSAVEGGAA